MATTDEKVEPTPDRYDIPHWFRTRCSRTISVKDQLQAEKVSTECSEHHEQEKATVVTIATSPPSKPQSAPSSGRSSVVIIDAEQHTPVDAMDIEDTEQTECVEPTSDPLFVLLTAKEARKLQSSLGHLLARKMTVQAWQWSHTPRLPQLHNQLPV